MSRHRNLGKKDLHRSINKICSSLQTVADATDVLATVLRASAIEVSDDIDKGRLLSETAGIHEGLSSTLRAWSTSMITISKENTNTMTAYIVWSELHNACKQLSIDIDSRSIAVNTAAKKLSLKTSDKTDGRKNKRDDYMVRRKPRL